MINHQTEKMQEDNRVFDEFSPRKLILQLQEIFRSVFRRWYIILLAGLIVGITAAMYYKFTKKNEYIAEITFILDEELTTQKKSGLSEITEQLGLGSSDGGTLFNSESNLSALLMSRLLIENTLRSPVPESEKKFTFADYFLDSLDYRNKWMKTSAFANTDFETRGKSKEEEIFQNEIIGNIHTLLATKHIKIEKKMASSNIITVACNSPHELFSKQFLEALINNVTTYYIAAQTKRAKINLEAINKRIDSVKNAYTRALYGKAAMSDANINLVLQKATVPGQQKQTDIDILRSAYIDLSLNLEAARTSLYRSTPVIQVLDEPMLPLKVVRVSALRKFIVFFLVGAFLAALFVTLSAIYKHIMKNGQSDEESERPELNS